MFIMSNRLLLLAQNESIATYMQFIVFISPRFHFSKNDGKPQNSNIIHFTNNTRSGVIKISPVCLVDFISTQILWL